MQGQSPRHVEVKKPKDYAEALTRAGMRLDDECTQAERASNVESGPYARGLKRAVDIIKEEYERA